VQLQQPAASGPRCANVTATTDVAYALGFVPGSRDPTPAIARPAPAADQVTVATHVRGTPTVAIAQRAGVSGGGEMAVARATNSDEDDGEGDDGDDEVVMAAMAVSIVPPALLFSAAEEGMIDLRGQVTCYAYLDTFLLFLHIFYFRKVGVRPSFFVKVGLAIRPLPGQFFVSCPHV